MNIQERIRKSKRCQVDLSVEASGMLLTIRAGDFTVQGETYSLAEDEEYEIGEYEDDAALIGYLVLTPEGDARLLVDELVGAAPPFVFKQADLKCLRRLFLMDLPAHTSSLDDLEMILYKTELLEEPEATDDQYHEEA